MTSSRDTADEINATRLAECEATLRRIEALTAAALDDEHADCSWIVEQVHALVVASSVLEQEEAE